LLFFEYFASTERCSSCWEFFETLVKFPCDCLFCVECWNNFLQLQFSDFYMDGLILPDGSELAIKCPIHEEYFINDRAMFKTLTPEKYEHYKNRAALKQLLASGGIQCPLENCGVLFYVSYSGDHILCPQCDIFFCKKCFEKATDCQCEEVEPIAHIDLQRENEEDIQEAIAQFEELATSGKLTQPIMAKTNTGNSLSISCYQNMTIRHLRASLHLLGYPMDTTQVIFAGKRPKDNEICNFAKDSTIHVVPISSIPSRYPPERLLSRLTRENTNKINELTHPCPSCGVRFSKGDGCSHMVCFSCHYEFCWICKGPYIRGRYTFNLNGPCTCNQ